MYIISYDVASKSLALSIIYFNENWKVDLKKIETDFKNEMSTCKVSETVCRCALKYIDILENFHDNLIQPTIFDVVDLIPGKKLKDVDVVTRSARLCAYLNMVDCNYIHGFHRENQTSETYKVLLEYQMGPNDKSRNVGSQILYHYSNMDTGFACSNKLGTKNIINSSIPVIKYDVEIIGPSLKNKISIDKDKPYSYFIQKYMKSYDANKAHSKANFLQWVKNKKCDSMIIGIKKKNLDDIADSVTMTLAWLYLKSGLI
jgi:hypothetical protein